MVLTTVKPSSGVSAPAQASAEYQPIELPVTATSSMPFRLRRSPSVQA
jgi:hypothetical protein